MLFDSLNFDIMLFDILDFDKKCSTQFLPTVGLIKWLKTEKTKKEKKIFL
jgi:hypothetical protein